MTALELLVEQLESEPDWNPGPLIDMLLARSRTGVHRIAHILSRLAVAVQSVWRTQLTAFMVHGTLASVAPLASASYVLLDGSVPSCVSAQSRDAISYVGRAIGTVKSARWAKQLPRSLASDHTDLLNSVLPEDQHGFDRVISQIRTNVSEWLWTNVLTQKDVEEAVDTLSDYFLLRNGEFALALGTEIERLKLSRLTMRSGPTSMIREQDLNLALLRASLGTTAQHDRNLGHLRFHLPSGPLRPLLPSLAAHDPQKSSSSGQPAVSSPPPTQFDDLLLGTPLHLTYNLAWPLDLFLRPSDIAVYGALFGYLAALRKTHTRIHTCWVSLSNAQRARRRWTGLGEGGTSEDLDARSKLARCGWGVVRDMTWFLDTLIAYTLTDVCEVEFNRLKDQLKQPSRPGKSQTSGTEAIPSSSLAPIHPSGSTMSASTGIPASRSAPFATSLSTSSLAAQRVTSTLDFTTLRSMHNTYLERLLTGCLLSEPALMAILRPILEVCERFVAQVERWGGDVLPALLFEGTKLGGEANVGKMVKERWQVVSEINEELHSLFESFYEQLSLSTSQQPFGAGGDASKSIVLNMSTANASSFHHTFVRRSGARGIEAGTEVRRHIERLLLRLDFNGSFSSKKKPHKEEREILKDMM